MNTQKWYQKNVWIIVMLFLFFPVGLVLMWKHSKWKEPSKIIISTFFGAMIIKSINNMLLALLFFPSVILVVVAGVISLIQKLRKNDNKTFKRIFFVALGLFISSFLIIIISPPFTESDTSPSPEPVHKIESSSNNDNEENEESEESEETDIDSIAQIFDVDWEKCIKDTTESVTGEHFDFVKDLYIEVKEEEKEIIFTAALADATAPEIALDYVDTLLRQFNLFASIQDSDIALGSKDYYGALYDQYNVRIGIAPLSATNDTSKWFVFDYLMKGMHTKHKIKLGKAYR